MTQPPESGPIQAGPWFDLCIERIIEETADARSVVFEIPPPLRDTFRYRAGQFLSFKIEVDGHKLVRCYSLASSPDTEVEHKVTVKRVEEGRASNWFNDVPKPGDSLHVMKPAGLFCLRDREASKKLLLFSGGSGITPVISLLKTALATTQRSVKLIYANRDRDSIIFREELGEIQSRFADRFELVHRLDVEDGFVDDAAVRNYVDRDIAADFYICGPGPFMDTIESSLAALGAAGDSVFIERFESPEEVAARHAGEHAASEPGGFPASVPTVLAVPAGDAPQTVVVTLDGETREISAEAGKTILEMARDTGLDPPFACEEGYCGCCMARLKVGTVEMKANDCLDESELAAGSVLTCQSVPTSARVEVEYPD